MKYLTETTNGTDPSASNTSRLGNKMDLYRLPPVLIVHLKRFLKNDHESSFFRNASRKITELVEFPLKSLDLSEYLINEEEQKQEWIYDLYGVSNHMGKLHGGHYTAS